MAPFAITGVVRLNGTERMQQGFVERLVRLYLACAVECTCLDHLEHDWRMRQVFDGRSMKLNFECGANCICLNREIQHGGRMQQRMPDILAMYDLLVIETIVSFGDFVFSEP